ncbi:MAG: SDR family NAD(P)-dependent oxidoreductase [Spirochaetaceae bacterium]|jgi:NAD(P)-dependent dehydrogenase (short-subunit alcohol dehydrogenase family)|nr:SDR family NAD(P)-dependent oxidoreductase [Spirochaetaceae bacterium]
MGIFSGKRALVVGGTGGIGLAVSLALASRGAALTIHGGSSGERLKKALAEARKRNIEAAAEGFLYPIKTPVEEAAVSILKKTAETGGPPDILILAWGPFKKLSLQETGPAEWRFLVESNLLFPGMMISSVICGMINQGWGRIVLFGGTNTGGIRGFTTTAAYSAAKTALGTLAKSAARQAGERGVTCNVICPGLTTTEYSTPEERQYNRERCPGGDAMDPGEIAQAVMGVLENPAFNGSVIPVDRGLWV